MKSSIERYTECSYADPLGMNGTGFVQMNVRFKVQLDLLSKQRYLFDLWQGGVGGRRHVNKTQHALPSELRRTYESHGEQV